MYSIGMMTKDIQAHVEEMYGDNISPAIISYATDKVQDVAKESKIDLSLKSTPSLSLMLSTTKCARKESQY